jgi:hypothetical protein
MRRKPKWEHEKSYTTFYVMTRDAPGGYKHLHVTIRKQTACDMTRELETYIQRYPNDLDKAVARCKALLDAQGHSVYFYGFGDPVELVWQSDKDTGFGKWYAPHVERMTPQEWQLKTLNRLVRDLDQGGEIGFYCSPRTVVETLLRWKAVPLQYDRGSTEWVGIADFDLDSVIPLPAPKDETPAEAVA